MALFFSPSVSLGGPTIPRQHHASSNTTCCSPCTFKRHLCQWDFGGGFLNRSINGLYNQWEERCWCFEDVMCPPGRWRVSSFYLIYDTLTLLVLSSPPRLLADSRQNPADMSDFVGSNPDRVRYDSMSVYCMADKTSIGWDLSKKVGGAYFVGPDLADDTWLVFAVVVRGQVIYFPGWGIGADWGSFPSV